MPPNNSKEELLRYYVLTCGFSLVPLSGKIPSIKNWTKLSKTTEKDLSLFSQGNIGIRTGKISNIVVLDVDPRHGGENSLNEFHIDFSNIPQVRTGSGGTHYYFKYPSSHDIKNSVSKLGPGLDIRSDGGQVVAPPSLHPDTQQPYEWILLPEQLSELPIILLEKLISIEVTEKKTPTTFSEGQRNAELTRIAGIIRAQGADEKALLFVLQSINKQRCLPPLEENEVTKIGKSIAQYSVNGDYFYDLTDYGNAELFCELFKDKLRYVKPKKLWFIWEENLWWRPDETEEVFTFVAPFTQHLKTVAHNIPDKERREQLYKWAQTSRSGNHYTTMIQTAKKLYPLADTGQYWDKDPFLLGVANGIIDLNTGILRPGKREDYIRRKLYLPYKPEATFPRWEQFLQEIFLNNRELIDYIQRAAGYSLTGDVSEQCLFFCYGGGQNGKSTFLNVLFDILGNYAGGIPFQSLSSKNESLVNNDLAALNGCRFATAIESRKGEQIDDAKIKRLASSDTIFARFLYEEYKGFKPTAKLWLAANNKPIVKDSSHAFWRRLRLIPFLVNFENRETKRLEETLKAESEGILSWLVQGCLKWKEQGLTPPTAVKEATLTYQQQEKDNQIELFLEECCEINSSYKVKSGDVYKSYLRWSDQQGFSIRERLTMTAFGRIIRELYSERPSGMGKPYGGFRLKTLHNEPIDF